MKKIIYNTVLTILLTAMAAPGAQASTTQDSVGCGVGTMIFQNSNGLLWSLFALTTNTTTFNTVSMTFGLVNCPAGASVRGRIATFIEFNKPELAVEIAQGKGDHLDALVEMYGVTASNRLAAIFALKSNQITIFSHQTTDAIQAEMDKTLQVFAS
jgi:hypothetical protein